MEIKGAGFEWREEAERRGGRNMVPIESEASVREGPGDDGIRDPRRRSGRHSHFGHIGFPAEIARALGCDRNRHKQLIESEAGQSTVEYAVLLFAVLSVMVALGSLGQLMESGLVVDHALRSASHHAGASVAGFVDAFMF